jgi:transcriptional regulator with XRE-family HTH domain
MKELVDRVTQLPQPEPGKLEVPPPELIGFIILWSRSMRQMKRSALADLAGVSLSTLERVERGEQVSAALIERIGAALQLEPGHLTAPRTPLPQEEVLNRLSETAKHMEFVKVKRLQTQTQLRELIGCHGFLPHAPDPQDEFKDDLNGLIEWLDHGAFLTGEFAPPQYRNKTSRRALYNDILKYISTVERNGRTILGGVMKVPLKTIPEWKVAVLSISDKARDPGAVKRRVMFVDRRCYHQGWKFLGEDELEAA